MEINDYAQRLAQSRSNFNEARNELREEYDREIESIKGRNEVQRNKQLENYKEAKGELENKLDSYVSEYSEKTKNTIKDRTEAYQRDLGNKQYEFDKDRKEIKNDMQRRLSDLTKTYEGHEKDREEYTNQVLESTKNRFDKQLGRLDRQFQNDLRQTQENSERRFEEYTQDQNMEKRELISNNDQKVRKLIKDDSVRRAQITERAGQDIQNLRESQSEQLSHYKNYQKEAIEEIKANKDRENEVLQENFRSLANDLSSRSARKRRQELKENKLINENLQKTYAKNLYQANREMQAKIKGGSRAENSEKKVAQTINNYEERIKNIYENIDEQNFLNQIDKERSAESFIEANREIKAKLTKLRENDIEKLNRERKQELSSLKDETNSQLKTYKNELTKSALRSEAQSIKDRNNSKKLLENQRKNFGETVKILNERNQEAVSKIQATHAQEKSKFIEDVKRKHHAEVEDVKYELKTTMLRKEASLQERNEQLSKLNEKIVNQYEEKIGRLTKKSAKEIERIKELNHRKFELERAELRKELTAKDRENEQEKIAIRQSYDKRLSRAKDTADRQIEKIVEYYEDLLSRERDESKNKLQAKVNEMRNDYEKLYQSAELEKATMQRQFSDRIEELRQANQRAIEEEARERRSMLG